MITHINIYDNSRIHEMIAERASGKREFKSAAKKVLNATRGAMGPHVKSGRLMSALALEKGKVDYYVTADAADYDWHAEFGHYIYFDEEGKRTDRKGYKTRKWVEGIGVLRKVVASFGGW